MTPKPTVPLPITKLKPGLPLPGQHVPIPTQPNPDMRAVIFQNWNSRFSEFLNPPSVVPAPRIIGDENHLTPEKNDDYLITTDFFRNHMDIRWANFTLSQDQKQVSSRLSLLFQAWSRFCQQEQLTWWLAHGTLIGWSFNQKILPWDVDIDVQTTTNELLVNYLRLNQTTFEGNYFFDVNKHIFYRQPQRGNQIDARFIDMHSGLYVDITALSRTPHGILQCKSPHYYAVSDIFPLHGSLFEGVQAFVPNQVAKILKKEYGDRVSLPVFQKGSTFYAFYPMKNEWTMVSRNIYLHAYRKMLRPTQNQQGTRIEQ